MFTNFRSALGAVVLSSAILLASASPALAGPATDFIKETSVEVSELLQQKDSKARQDKFSAKLNATVDFRELASRALGEHWTKQSAEEQQKFLDLLQRLLEANYREKLTGQTLGEDYEIEYVDERTRKNLAIVETRIKWDEHVKPVGYKLLKKADGWVIYDIVIDDISLVETYRDAYTEIIEKEGWDSLISRMEEKAAQLQAAKSPEKK
jgi:phospholipid transport system substrate-binding protein